MYRYLIILFDLWIILASDTSPDLSKIINRTPLLLTNKLGTFYYPRKARINKDQKQEYYYSSKHDVHHFCPLEATKKNHVLREDIKATQQLEYEYCLFEKKFKKEETPICKKEVRPFLVQKRDTYGQQICGTGRMYQFVYVVCVEKAPVTKLWRMVLRRKTPKGDVFSDVRHPLLYEVCHDHSPDVNRTLFTHHTIRSPYILRNLILEEENRLHNYTEPFSTERYTFEALENLKNHFEAYKKQKEYEASHIQKQQEEAQKNNTPVFINIALLELEMLTPAGDFALGHWKKATYHMLNYSPLNRLHLAIWRAANAYVYNRLIELYDEIKEVDIYTGTYGDIEHNGQKVYLGHDEKLGVTIPLIWWKLLFVPASKKIPERRGLVIIMHAIGGKEKICEEEKKACDPRTWETKFHEQYYEDIYCCSVPAAYAYISTIGQLRIKSVGEISLFELG